MINKEILLESTELYLKSLISEVAQLAIGDNGMSTPFQELGIDSFRVLQIIRKLEEEFGTLPKTLLFENFNISDLSNYFVDKHQQTLAVKFTNGNQALTTPAHFEKEPLKPVEVISDTVANQAQKPLRKTPILILEKEAHAHPELGVVVKKLFDQYKNEGSASRGTRNIAPNLFIGSEQRGYFNYSRSKNIILVYTYTGPKDYFPIVAGEMYRYCISKNFEFNLFTSDQLKSIGDFPFSATPFGVLSRIINIKDFSLQGNKMRRLRYQVSKFEDAGRCRTEEYHCGSNEDIDKSIADIIDQWCAPRTMVNPLIHIVKAEILAGSLNSQHRLFLTYLNDVLQNVILISKLSAEENGYLMDLEFYPESMPLGGLDFAIVKMMEILAAEGCNMLSLGGTYGCKLASSSNADPELDKTLNYLREQNIFNDEGNLQFKNKFRPEHHTVFLCRPVGSNPDNVTEIIMMIADPTKMQTSDAENHTSFNSRKPVASVENRTQKHDTRFVIGEINPDETPQQTGEVMIEGEERSIILSDFNYNPLNIPDSKVEFDLKTDSWAQLEMPGIQNQLRYLHTQLQQSVNLDESLKSIFPFSHFALTTSGRTAEHAFFKSWTKKGIVLQNLLFPTTIFHQIDNDFTPEELPHPEVFKLESTELYKGDLAWEALQKQVEQDPKSIAFALIEVNDNAAGGAAVSLQHLKKVKTLLSKYSIPLVVDGTRVVENARIIIENEKEFAGKNIWDVVREIFSYADAIIASLAKDFCVNKGGLIATNDVNLFNKLQDLIQEESIGLDVIDKKVIALSLQNKSKIETQVLQRIESVRLIWNALKQQGIPVVQPVGGHCILIDVKQIPEFRQFEFPIPSFVAWMFLNTGIRGGAHNAGMQKNTSINNLVRLAIPVGLKRRQVEDIIDRLTHLFKAKKNIPEILLEGSQAESFGDIHAKFQLKKYHNASGNVVTKTIGAVSPQVNNTETEQSSVSNSDLYLKEVGLKQNVSNNKFNQSRDIAIIGMAGRYPKATNMTEFWDNLFQGKDCIGTIPDARFEQRLRNKFSEKYRGGFIDDVDKFDSLFFNISPREAEHLDPQERLFLEVAWETIEDAGYYPETLAENDASRNIGVFVGAVWTLYQMLGVEEKLKGNNLNPSSHLWGIANRASYVFNLSGPSLSIDTACSSSLTAVYLACEAINNGECNGAIVGGVNLDVHQSKIDINNGGGALSKDGVCRTFGKGANGYVAGEGVGAVFLKPLEQAIKDGDNIYGVIKGTAVNHGGKTSGFMVPSPHSQAKVITTAIENARIDARSIGYIEAHGTGTELGDPIEINGLTTAFQKYNVGKQSCSIGSVKTNIGHLEAAAGIVGIQKVLLQMKHQKLVPSLHSSELNPFIDFENSPFYVEQVAEEWKPKVLDGIQFPLRAGISSFGAGGANAHVIIEAYNAPDLHRHNSAADNKDRIFPISAKNEDQLREAAIRLRSFIQKDLCSEPTLQLDLNDIAHTLRIGRKSFDYRLAIVAKTKEELVEKLTLFIESKKDDMILAGQVKNSEGITRLLSRKEKEEFIKLLTQSGDLRKVAQLWVEGLLLDWQGIQVFEAGKKISLPTYPFADKRHWISDVSKTAGLTLRSKIGIHPLIDSNESTFERQIFKKTFNDKEFFIYDHLVSEIPTLPGVAYLDFARKAGELAAGRKVQKIKNILWLSPLTVVNSKPTEAFIELKPNGDLVQFEVYSEKENGQKQVHSQGKISYATAHDLEAEEEFIDLESIRARCVRAMDGKDAYPHFKSLGLDLGPSFQVLQEVFQNQNEILGVLRIPEARQGDFQDFLLHPSLIDGTGQTGMAAQLAENSNGNSGQMFVPYSFGEVEILHAVPQKCFAYVKKANDPNAKVTRTNILVVDESGKVVVKIKDSVGVPLVSVHEKPDHETSTSEFSKLYYSPVWEKSPLVLEKNTYDSILLFDTDEKLSKLYKARLKAAGKDLLQIVVVKPGDHFQDLGQQTYTINPQNPKDFTQLFAVLGKTKFTLEKICFAWSFDHNLQTRNDYNGDILKASLATGVYSFLFLCQALVEQKYKNTIQLLYLYQSEKEKLQPHHDAMNGFIKTLHIEHPKLSCKVLEIQQLKSDLDKILDSVLVEFGRDNQQEMTVRYEEGERHVRKLKEHKFEEIGNDFSTQGLGLKEKGVYIIAGGAGGLGLIFAEYLAKEYKARLVLTGRSELSAERKVKLEQLCNFGAEVLYFAADISNVEDVENLVKESKAKFGSINGIINSAGVLRDSYIRNKTQKEMDAVFAPKLYGSLHLDAATQHDDLDFFVMFSSMAAVGGNMGQCDYSFANNFMDSFAAHRENLKAKGKRSGKTLSLNWSIWADGGMKLDEQMEVFFKKNLGIIPLSIETGITAFTKGLSIKGSQLAVVEGVQEKIELAWGLRKEEPVIAASINNSQQTTSSEASTPTADKDLIAMVQNELSQIVMDFLKLDADDISLDKILMDLGFDSIGLATFANAVNDKYKLDDVTPVLFFEYPSIKDIAKFLYTEHKLEMLQRHQTSRVSTSATASHAAAQTKKIEHVQEISIGFKKSWNPNGFNSIAETNAPGVNFSAERRFIDMPIAIVGMSGVMPQADDLDEYWEKLKNAENNMVTLVPEDRWKWEDYYGNPFEEKNKTKIKFGGFMRQVDTFDPLFWGISPREAVMMDPQQRIFLETVWKAVEDSGHKVSDLSGTKTGIFVGAATRDYIDLMGSLEVELDGYSGSGTSHAVLANRVSFLLNLHGPSAPLDTACSSSLVALHRAIESIHTGSSDQAIVGGVQVMLTPAGHISFGAAGMLSEDGKCKTFDERANGYVRGEGSGAIFIKPLAKAEADGDHIYAIIKATAENHGGKVTVLTAPNPSKQAELLIEAYEKAEIDPTTVGYIECHGTGTSLGDPIEIQALKKAFAELYKRNNKGPVTKPHIGLTSAKTNIGHLETAAGIAGILKVLLSIRHGQIPALLHFEKLNPYIKLEGTPFYMVDKTRPWETINDENGNSLPRRAGVSSFGFGGANVHVILEEYISPVNQSLNNFTGPYLIVLSAKNEERLKAYARLILSHVKKGEVDLADFAYTLQVGRDAMTVRLGFTVNSVDELVEKLDAYIDGKQNIENVYQGKVNNKGVDIDDNRINTWFSDKNDSKLLEAWASGLDLDWNRLYDNTKPKRISLPTYPFAREKYWFRASTTKQVDTTATTISVLHPLVHTNTSDLSRQSYSSTFSGDEFFIKDCQYKGQKILPAASYFEIARVAIDRATPALQKTNVLELRNIVYENPIVINQSKQVTIALFADDHEQIEFEIFCADKDQEIVHCVGQAKFINSSRPGTIAIQKLLAQMSQRQINITELYVDFEKVGLKYGTSLKATTAIYQKDQQILVQLNVPDAIADSQGDYLLHPSLMESVVQASVGLLTDFKLSGLSAPPSFALDSLSIVSACAKNMYAWIRFAQGNTNGKAHLDIDLCDQQGNVCVQMRGFSIPQLSVSIDLQVKQMVSMVNKMEETFTSLGSSKPKQIKLAGLQEITTSITIENPTDPIKVSQRSLESIVKPNQPSFERDTLYSETQLYETALRASAVHDYVEIVKTSQLSNEMISQEQLQRQLATSLAEALYLNTSDVDIDKSFIDLGLDSIVGVEWLNTINKKYKIAIPASVVYDYPTVGKMASFLYQELNSNVTQDIAATSESSLTPY